MRFYRRLLPFDAISFDLDDTLYSNQPIMLATDAQMIIYFKRIFSDYGLDSSLYTFDFRFWWPFRQQVIAQTPMLKHDIGLLREKSYYLGALSLGLPSTDAQSVADLALGYFVEQRSNFTLPQQTHDLLSYLKRRVPLVAITNGNVDTNKIGIAKYFSAHFNASTEHKLKPDRDMFDKACMALQLRSSQLLHVGDCGKNDVFGAINAGCQTAWLNPYKVGKPLKILPTLALDNIEQLAKILP
ncbi:HAD-IA family hydrolase [Colwellia sp. BRX10-3]|uniref:HAD-IA family hydrolase n=1 Tax=Colwellia sp. BRX10-3 TaxID=2759844 RepID=UPI0015F38A67|nr:HAD-IA family hydrolase [Colwellia sp. BRX10-3]MBA6390035.1 HAD-IA family hydrolase [Colwellia sp. BRX10-3]